MKFPLKPYSCFTCGHALYASDAYTSSRTPSGMRHYFCEPHKPDDARPVVATAPAVNGR